MLDGKLIRKAEKLAVETMKESLSENSDKPHPCVGAVALFPNGETICCHRGELSDGEHAEYGLLERKCKDRDLGAAVVFTTLEPCYARNKPKEPCCVRLKKRHVKIVYMGIDDPDPSVAGQGKEYLEENGIEIHYFPRDLQVQIKDANEAYLKDAIKRASECQEPIKKEEADAAPYLKRICVSFDRRDINEKELGSFAKKAGIAGPASSVIDSLVSIGLTKKEKDVISFTNAFVILFAKRPSKYLNNSVIKLKYHESDFEIDEPLIKAPSTFADWISERMPSSTVRGRNADRDSKYAYPLDPIKEAFINALVHRDYSLEGTHVQAILSDGSLTINSPGSVVDPQTLIDLSSFDAASIVRNHEINYVFKIMGFVENNNLGMDKFKNIPVENRLPSPIYRFKNPILSISFFFDFSSLADGVRFDYPDGLSDNELSTLEIMRSREPLTNADLMAVLPMPNSKAAQRVLSGLEEKGLVVSKGKTKGTIYLRNKIS